MSVFSKIFIVINLALTLLLCAVMGTQINLKGLYKIQYREYHEAWRLEKDRLSKTKSDYLAQIKDLTERSVMISGRGRGGRLGDAEAKRDALKGTLQTRDGTIGELSRAKSALQREIDGVKDTRVSTEGEIRSQRDDLTQARKQRDEAVDRTRRAINTWNVLQLLIQDAKEKAEARGK